jgi:uncharacterized Zn finger protein (UPF0148 family)
MTIPYDESPVCCKCGLPANDVINGRDYCDTCERQARLAEADSFDLQETNDTRGVTKANLGRSRAPQPFDADKALKAARKESFFDD